MMKWWIERWWRVPLAVLAVWLIGDWQHTILAGMVGVMLAVVVTWLREIKEENKGDD